jgi:hypothetical protein
MLNSTYLRKGLFNYSSGSFEQEYWTDAYYRTFWFSGFGSNDPKKRKKPTQGQYHLDERTYMKGSYTGRVYDSYLSETYSTNMSGVMTGAVVDHLGSYDVDWWIANYNNALTKLYDQIRQSNSNLATSVGEARETAVMISKAVEAVKTLTVTARRLKRRLLHEPSKVFADAWLSYKLGWYPLYKDVYSLLEYTTRRFDEQTFYGRATMSPSINDRWSSGDNRYFVSGRRIHRTHIQVTCGVSDPTAFDTSRITSLNPASVAWELVPFSFFVDYFVDIGGFLALQEAALGTGLTFKSGFWTDVLRLEVSEDWYQSVSGSDIRYRWSQTGYARATRKKTSKYRWVLTEFPRPMPPTLKVSLGSQRLLTAVALFRNVLLGKV